jgi:hypothetical protein
MRPEVQVLPGPQTIEASGASLLASPSRLSLSNIGRFVESPGGTTGSRTVRRTEEVAGAQVRGARRIGGRHVRRRPQAEKRTGRCRPLARGNLDPLSASLAASPAGCGDVAQVVEHRLCKAGVRGSSPLVSTHQTPVFLLGCRRRTWARLSGRRCYSATVSTLGGLRGSAGCRSGARAPALGTVGRRRRLPLAQVAPWLRRAYCRSCHEGSHEKSVAGVVAFGVEVGGRDPVIDGR